MTAAQREQHGMDVKEGQLLAALAADFTTVSEWVRSFNGADAKARQAKARG